MNGNLVRYACLTPNQVKLHPFLIFYLKNNRKMEKILRRSPKLKLCPVLSFLRLAHPNKPILKFYDIKNGFTVYQYQGKTENQNMRAQIDRRSPLSFQRLGGQKRSQLNYYYQEQEQRRSATLMNLPLAQFMKTYERYEAAVEKSRAEGRKPHPGPIDTPLMVKAAQWLRPRLTMADIERWKNVPTAYFIRNYQRLRDEVVVEKKKRPDYNAMYNRQQTVYKKPAIPVMQNNLQSSNNEVQQPYKVQRPPPPIKMPTLEFPQPYQSDSELAKLYQPPAKAEGQYEYRSGKEPTVVKWEPSKQLLKKDSAENFKNYIDLLRPRGIISYVRRRNSYEEPDTIEGTLQYAYVDLERLEDVIKKFRRQREPPKKTLHDEPDLSSSVEVSRPSVSATPAPKMMWFYSTADAYNHIKIDADAPELTDLLPEVKEEEDQKLWFYQGDHNSSKED
ncbi:hypothetical protein B5X24_HaOG201571 [Helicoverpa armigera]|nr:hypothetical protein B5X24_HaOG201571 [Helicoverpa armigera]